jgi:hypothetical protein
MRKQVLGSLMLLGAAFWPLHAEEVRTLPPEAYALMKSGHKLDQLWINPKYDTATGFGLGKITTLADGLYANTVDYLGLAFQHLTVPGSANVLNLTVTRLTTVDHGFSGYFSASMAVEGEVLDPKGQLMVVFSTQATVKYRQTVLDNCKGVCDLIAWSLYKDLGKGFEHAMAVKSQVTEGVNPSGLVPPRPAPDSQPMDIQGRLLRLDDLKKKGLITDDEYNAHKDEILKGL